MNKKGHDVMKGGNMTFDNPGPKSKMLAKGINRTHLISICQILIVLLVFTRCASFITYYDPITYTNLIELKPEVVFLYETFTTDSADTEKIAEIRLRFAQIREYERWKGEKNKETYEQVETIQDMFERHVNDRLEKGPWVRDHFENKKTNIEEAFDGAIQTERLKNKNE